MNRGDIVTFPVTGGANSAVAGKLIVTADAANAGNVAVSTAGQKGFVGITEDPTDVNGYAPIRLRGIARVKVGTGGVSAGDQVASDATGQAVTITPAGTGSVKQVVGVAVTTAAAGGVAEILLQPGLALV